MVRKLLAFGLLVILVFGFVGCGEKGKVDITFVDPLSNSGCVLPRYELAKMGEAPDSFFGRYIFAYAHDKSIRV